MQFNLGIYDICYITTTVVFGSMILFFYIPKLKKEIKTLKRQYEKKSIGADDSSLRVKTLENKIATLEVALKKQIEKNSQNK